MDASASRTSGSKWTNVSGQGDGFSPPDRLSPGLTRCTSFHCELAPLPGELDSLSKRVHRNSAETL
jgi:hypothetical protein